MKKISLSLGIAAFICAISPAAFGAVTIYPEPGPKLAEVSHLRQSSDYTVTVNGRACFVYESEKYFKHPKGWGNRPQDKVSFTSFAFQDEPVTIKVTASFAVKSATIRPRSANIKQSVTGNTISFTLTAPQKLSVEVNDQKRPLLIVAERPDVPDTGATHYYAPGVHKIGTKKDIKAGESVYIAGGAVVEGTFLCLGDHIRFGGRGILTSGYIPWATWNADSSQTMFTYPRWRAVTAHDFEGLFLVNSPGWYNRGELVNSTVKNVKFIAWNGNTDGLHLGGNSLMEDCLFFQNDDCLIGNNGNSNTWRNCVIWKGNYGRPIISLQCRRTLKGYLWENIDIIGLDGREPVVQLENFRGGANQGTMEDFVFRNVRVESPRVAPLVKIEANNFTIKNLMFENVTTDTLSTNEGQITATGTGRVEGVVFRNLRLADQPITRLESAKISVKGAVSGVSFKAGAPAGTGAARKAATP